MTNTNDLRKLADRVLRYKGYGPDCQFGNYEDFRDAANPTAILELIAELDALKAENERLQAIRKRAADYLAHPCHANAACLRAALEGNDG